MALIDKIKWDKKHLDTAIGDEPVKLVKDFAHLSKSRVALELACGMGRNAKFLALEGFEVDAVDISSVAIDSLREIKNIHPIEADLDTYQPHKDRYDLIVCTYFLDRTLFVKIEEALKEGGLFLYESYIYHKENEIPTPNKNFLLLEGELERTFEKRYELLHIKEWWDSDSQDRKVLKGSMVAKKRAGGMTIEDFWS